jgi:DMSO/TMAO reductase YedYZ molybdopterin-dependent catalytic subunit
VRLAGGAPEPPEHDMAAVPTPDSPVVERAPTPWTTAASSASIPRALRYYESIDLIDAAHPQTILAYDINGKPLTVPHGAPLRLRL